MLQPTSNLVTHFLHKQLKTLKNLIHMSTILHLVHNIYENMSMIVHDDALYNNTEISIAANTKIQDAPIIIYYAHCTLT